MTSSPQPPQQHAQQPPYLQQPTGQPPQLPPGQPGFPIDPAITQIKNRALVAMIVGFALGGVLPGILGLVGYLKADTEPRTAKQFTKWAWVSFAILWGLVIVIFVVYIAFMIIMMIVVFAGAGAAGGM